jgi:hypothetical protein
VDGVDGADAVVVRADQVGAESETFWGRQAASVVGLCGSVPAGEGSGRGFRATIQIRIGLSTRWCTE